MASGGRFITLEGIEGAGKSTQARRLAHALAGAGRDVVVTREPGGGLGAGAALRELLKDPAVWRRLELSEIWLYAADRADHLETVILPALARNAIVVCDRFLDSTRAYQGYGRGRPLDLIEAIHRLPPLDVRPHRTILLDVPAAVGLERARARGDDAGERAGYDNEDLEFFGRVRDGYRELARREPSRWIVVDATREEDVVAAEIAARVRDVVEPE